MKRNKGFTLVELLVVIAIIGILSSVVFASLNSARAKARVASVQSTLRSVMPELQSCADDLGFGYTAGAPSANTTFVCQNALNGNAAKGTHTVRFPTLPVAGGWAYVTPTGAADGQNGIGSSANYVYSATGDQTHTVTCYFTDGHCESL